MGIVRVNIVYVFEVVANNTYIRRCDFIGSDDEIFIVDSNKVHNDI